MRVFFFKQKTAYELLISDWSSDVCSSDLRSGHKRVHAKAVLAIVCRRHAGQPDHRMLRADIFAVHRHADRASDGCGVDDRSLRPALDHRKDLVLHAQERAGYIDIHSLPTPSERHFGKRQSGLRDRRIVERPVKPAERRQSLPDKCLHVLFLCDVAPEKSEEHTSELQSLMRISSAVFCLKKNKKYHITQ